MRVSFEHALQTGDAERAYGQVCDMFRAASLMEESPGGLADLKHMMAWLACGMMFVRRLKGLEAREECLRAVLACERDRRKASAYPETLDALEFFERKARTKRWTWSIRSRRINARLRWKLHGVGMRGSTQKSDVFASDARA